MSAKRQIFKLGTLNQLLNEENSCVSLVSCTRLLLIPPFYLNDMKGGVIFSLNKLLKKYDPTLNGIIIGYQNLTILWNEDSGKIRMGCFEAELDVRVEFYVFQPRIGNILEGLINKKSKNHIGCLVHHCFNATILKPEDITCEDWICKDYNINDKVLFKVKDLDFTGSVPYIEGEIDESLFTQHRPSIKNSNCDFKNSEEIENEVSKNTSSNEGNYLSPDKIRDEKKHKKKRNNDDEEQYSFQIKQSNALQPLKSTVDLSNQINEINNSEWKTQKSIKGNDTTAILDNFKLTKDKTKKKTKNEDEVDKGEENEVKKKKDKKSKKKDKDGGQIQIQDFNTLTEEKCVDSLHDDSMKKNSLNAESSKSKKTKKRKKEKPFSQLNASKKTMEEETDNVFYSTQLDTSKKSEKLTINFCSPILPDPVLGNKKRKKEKDKRHQVLELSLGLAKQGEDGEKSSTKDKKVKGLKRKREKEAENEGASTPKKYKNGNMYDVMYSQSPQKTYFEDKSLFSDSEKSFKISSFKKEVKLNGDVHDMLKKCDTGKDVHRTTVQSLLDELRKEVIERFQSESEIQNDRESCQGGEKSEKSKMVKGDGNKEENKAQKKKKKKEKEKEKEKTKIKGSKETSLTENTTISLYDKLLQEAMNSINLTNDEASSASSATKSFVGKKQRRKKRTKEESKQA